MDENVTEAILILIMVNLLPSNWQSLTSYLSPRPVTKWNVHGTGHCACFAACWGILACPVPGSPMSRRHLTGHNGLYPADSITWWTNESLKEVHAFLVSLRSLSPYCRLASSTQWVIFPQKSTNVLHPLTLWGPLPQDGLHWTPWHHLYSHQHGIEEWSCTDTQTQLNPGIKMCESRTHQLVGHIYCITIVACMELWLCNKTNERGSTTAARASYCIGLCVKGNEHSGLVTLCLQCRTRNGTGHLILVVHVLPLLIENDKWV